MQSRPSHPTHARPAPPVRASRIVSKSGTPVAEIRAAITAHPPTNLRVDVSELTSYKTRVHILRASTECTKLGIRYWTYPTPAIISFAQKQDKYLNHDSRPFGSVYALNETTTKCFMSCARTALLPPVYRQQTLAASSRLILSTKED